MRTTTKSLLLTGALASAVLGTAVTPAAAAPAAAPAAVKVLSVSDVMLPNAEDKALVAGTYTCTGRFTHLWVSVKQGPGDLTQEGSSEFAKAWYQRTMDNVIPCDGKRHTLIVRVDRTKGDLHRGRAYVQFCLLSANSLKDLQEGKGAFSSDMTYRGVARM